MKHKFPILILIIMLSTFPVRAELEYTFPQFFDETIDFIIQPGKWDGGDYLKLGGVFAATGLTMFADQPLRDAVLRDERKNALGKPIQETQKYFFSVPVVAGRMYGELYSPVVFFAGFAAYSLIFDDLKARKIAYEVGQASLYAGGLTFLFKFAIGRARPYMEEGNQAYHPFASILVQDYHSMPGGHSCAAFVISTVLAKNVDPVWAKVLLYIPAGLTFASRVYQDQHWTSDDFIGAAFGYFIAAWVVDKHEKAIVPDKQQSMMDRIKFQPMMLGDSYGMNLSFRIN